MSTVVSWIEVEVEVEYQHLYPVSDVATGSWSVAPLWSKLNEENTEIKISSSGTVFAELEMADPASVGAGPVSIAITARKTTSDANTLVVTLMEGATARATWTITELSTTFVLYTLELTPAEVSAISDWDNLRVRISHPEGS